MGCWLGTRTLLRSSGLDEPFMAQPIRWRGTARIRGPTKSVRMVLLTLVLVGLQ
jgi:hypothetical protein